MDSSYDASPEPPFIPYHPTGGENSTITPLEDDLGRSSPMFDLMHELIFARDMQGRIIFWNRAAQQKYGWSEKEALGQHAATLLKKQFPIPWAEIEQKLMSGECWDGNVIHTKRDGTPLIVESRIALIKKADGTPAGFFEINNDLTHHTKSEDESEHFFNLSLDMFCVAGFDGYFKRVNPAMQTTLGYCEKELLSRPYLEFIHPDDVEATRVEAHKIEKGASTISFENRYRCKDGSYKWLLWKTVVLGDRQITYSTARDRTPQKQAELEMAAHNARLAQSNQELQEFAQIASHDLQEPLRKIQAFGDRLRTQYSEILDEEGRDYIERMQNSAHRMRTLIEDLLTFSRVSTQAQPFEEVDLSQVIAVVLADLDERLKETGGRVEVGEMPPVKADPMQMQHLFQNLISNALKFHRENEPPVVRIFCDAPPAPTQKNPTFCRVAVCDNGIGFDDKYNDRIFQAFQRLHGRLEYEGTGIGLAICRKIVQRHGSHIAAESIPGQGSKFFFELPLWKERAPRNTIDEDNGGRQ